MIHSESQSTRMIMTTRIISTLTASFKQVVNLPYTILVHQEREQLVDQYVEDDKTVCLIDRLVLIFSEKSAPLIIKDMDY